MARRDADESLEVVGKLALVIEPGPRCDLGQGRVVDELVARFTHSIRMDWLLPGIPPTGKHIELPFVVVVQFEGDKLAHEHLYWDQASVLVQVGLLDRTLPVRGGETAAQVLNPTQPMNELIRRASGQADGSQA